MSDIFNEDELQEEIDFFISTLMGRVLGDYALKSAPKDGSIEAALDAYTKEKLLKLAAENGLTVQRKWKKAKLVEVLSEGLMDSLEARFLISQKRALTLLQYMADGKFDLVGYDFERIEFLMTVFESAVRMGIIYVSEEAENVVMDMPIPIKEKLDEVLAEFEDFEAAYENEFDLLDEMNVVLTAGVNLYGVLTVGKFYDLWKIRHPFQDVAQITESYDKFEKYLPLLIIRNGYYFVDGNLIANPTFDNEEDVLDFYQYRTYKMGYSYYMPSKEEILYYSQNEFNRETHSYKQLQLAVAKMTEDFEMVMQMVESHILLGDDVTDLFMYMADMGVMDFEFKADLAKFVNVYNTVKQNTRLWENAGFTPTEMIELGIGHFGMMNEVSNYLEDDDFDDFDSDNIISLDDFR